jgi:curved DNA-binding protein CbpA
VSDYYDILGVGEKATLKEIKKAHRKLAFKYHPDKNNHVTTREFLDIQRAYEVLSNPKSRAMYDEHGFAQTDDLFRRMTELAASVTAHVLLKEHVQPDLYINEVERQLKHALDKHAENLEQINGQYETLVAQKEVLELKNKNGLDIMRMAIDNLINGRRAELLVAKQHVDTHEALLKLVEKYVKGEAPKAAHVVFNINTGSTTGGWG